MIGGGLPMPPAMVGYYNTSKFGGYVNLSLGERFGVLVAQAESAVHEFWEKC